MSLYIKNDIHFCRYCHMTYHWPTGILLVNYLLCIKIDMEDYNENNLRDNFTRGVNIDRLLIIGH